MELKKQQGNMICIYGLLIFINDDRIDYVINGFSIIDYLKRKKNYCMFIVYYTKNKFQLKLDKQVV